MSIFSESGGMRTCVHKSFLIFSSVSVWIFSKKLWFLLHTALPNQECFSWFNLILFWNYLHIHCGYPWRAFRPPTPHSLLEHFKHTENTEQKDLLNDHHQVWRFLPKFVRTDLQSKERGELCKVTLGSRWRLVLVQFPAEATALRLRSTLQTRRLSQVQHSSLLPQSSHYKHPDVCLWRQGDALAFHATFQLIWSEAFSR